MSNTKTVMGQASNQYVVPTDITDVFSTYLYEGNGSTQTITNGIDLDGEGGLVWVKDRDAANGHNFYDTERGATKRLASNLTSAETTRTNGVTSFNSNGFSGGNDASINTNGNDYASWTFRKAPKFFTCVTWTGDGVAGRTVSHNLGSAPGVIIVKRLDVDFENWRVYHRSLGPTYNLVLNNTNAATQVTSMWNNTAPTSTEFTLGSDGGVNSNNRPYVAYLFAHNDGDGEFGPDGDQDIIKCGSYTGNGSTDGPEIDLGFEPQWLLIKNADYSGAGWSLWDNMRGVTTGGTDQRLYANESSAEATTGGDDVYFTSTGFGIGVGYQYVNNSGDNIIYIAIRRGPLAPPESATEVFDVSTRNASEPAYTSGFPVDFAFARAKNIANNWDTGSRLQQGNRMFTNLDNAEASNSNMMFDYQEGWSAGTGASTDYLSWMWKRAPNFFDVVAYEGNGTAGHTVSHNLGVVPEMMWVKVRNSTYDWTVYHKDIGATDYLELNTTNASAARVFNWNDTEPTTADFTVGSGYEVNRSGFTYIAYLFASLPGISKVGSYTGNGSSQTIDCGFTSGARFILIKRTDSTGDWYVWDSVRGIVAGNDPYLELNTTDAEVTSTDWVDPDNSGFIVNGTTINASSASYIFYAIA